MFGAQNYFLLRVLLNMGLVLKVTAIIAVFNCLNEEKLNLYNLTVML